MVGGYGSLNSSIGSAVVAFIRKVRTASDAMAVQIVEKVGRCNRVIEHIGSARGDAEIAALIATARVTLLAGQQALELNLGADAPAAAGRRRLPVNARGG